jgi:hypothetical protein
MPVSLVMNDDKLDFVLGEPEVEVADENGMFGFWSKVKSALSKAGKAVVKVAKSAAQIALEAGKQALQAKAGDLAAKAVGLLVVG